MAHIFACTPGSLIDSRPVFDELVPSIELHLKTRAKLLALLQAPTIPVVTTVTSLAPRSAVLLVGGETRTEHPGTDKEIVFRQESNFQYLFGVEEADCAGVIDVDTGKSYLFFPDLPASYAVWLGKIEPLSFYQAKYKVDGVLFTSQLEAFLAERGFSTLLLLDKSPPAADDCAFVNKLASTDKVKVDREILPDVLGECRITKLPEEVDIIRHNNAISSFAHIMVMKHAKPGMYEYELEALFKYIAYKNGRCREMAYTCICAAGLDGATLHYPTNRKQIGADDMLLLDMGAEYYCYSSDITCSFPASGVFSQGQREVYDIVLQAVKAVTAQVKPGVAWEDMHALALRTIAAGLIKYGFLQPAPASCASADAYIDLLMERDVPALFMPHGLGHFMGLDVHDPAGYPRGVARIDRPSFRNLRVRRVLAPGMVVTIEPGCYFNTATLGAAKTDDAQRDFLNWTKIDAFANFGGVRIEDDIVITETGFENLTKVNREIDEIEAYMKKQ